MVKDGTEFIAVKCPFCKGTGIETNPDNEDETKECDWCWNGIVLKEKKNSSMYYSIHRMFGHREEMLTDESLDVPGILVQHKKLQRWQIAGRFNTETKTKISTEHGTILKVTLYLEDNFVIEEYRIRPKCDECGGDLDCICFNENNSDKPFEDAIINLKRKWICARPQCQVNYLKKDDPEYYKELFDSYNGNIEEMAQGLLDDMDSDLDEGELCSI